MSEKHRRNAVMLDSNHLFEVNKTETNLSKEDAQIFYTIVDKIMFLIKQVGTDILTIVVFPTTRFRYPY